MLVFALACTPDLDSALGEDVPCTRCALTDANQYRLEAALDAEELPVLPQHDVNVDFTGLTVDIQGHDVDPLVDIDQASLLAFRDLTAAEIRDGLVNNTLEQADVVLWLTAFPTTGVVALSEFGTMGNTLDAQQYLLDGSTWLVALQANAGRTASSMVFLAPNAGSEVSAVTLTNESSRLTATVDLAALQPLAVAPGDPGLILDWAAVATDGFGHEFAATDVSQLLLARYDDSPEELASSVLDLDRLAAESWTMELGGSTWANLGALRGDTAFRGIATGSTWLMLLRCETCLNPAPFLLARLEASS